MGPNLRTLEEGKKKTLTNEKSMKQSVLQCEAALSATTFLMGTVCSSLTKNERFLHRNMKSFLLSAII